MRTLRTVVSHHSPNNTNAKSPTHKEPINGGLAQSKRNTLQHNGAAAPSSPPNGLVLQQAEATSDPLDSRYPCCDACVYRWMRILIVTGCLALIVMALACLVFLIILEGDSWLLDIGFAYLLVQAGLGLYGAHYKAGAALIVFALPCAINTIGFIAWPITDKQRQQEQHRYSSMLVGRAHWIIDYLFDKRDVTYALSNVAGLLNLGMLACATGLLMLAVHRDRERVPHGAAVRARTRSHSPKRAQSPSARHRQISNNAATTTNANENADNSARQERMLN